MRPWSPSTFFADVRDGKAENRQLRLRARPESFQAPYVVDTGLFDAQGSFTSGLEAYYRSGSLLVGSELFLQDVDSDSTGDPSFNGGEVFVAWNVTGETRPYKPAGGNFLALSPSLPVGQGRRRTSFTAASLNLDPSSASKIFIAEPPSHTV